MDFGKIMKKLRGERNLTQIELSERTGISKSSISMYENGNRTPELETFELLADFYNVDMDYLKGKSNIKRRVDFTHINESGVPYVVKHKIPVLGRVQAGIPIEAIEEIIDYEEISKEMARCGEYFGLQIKGESMEPKFSQGDVVIVRKQTDIESGQIGIVIVNDTDATVKRIVKHDEGGISLIALNPAYPPKFYTNNEISNMPVTIIGRVVELRAKF